MFLDLTKALGVTINRNTILFIIDIVFVFYTVIDQIEDEFIHIQAIFLLERKHALVVEQESKRAHSSEVATKLIKDAANVADGTCSVIRQRIYKDSNAMWAIALIGHWFVIALVFTGRILYCALDIILGHVLALRIGYDSAKRRVVFRFRTSRFNSYGYLFPDLCKSSRHMPPAF